MTQSDDFSRYINFVELLASNYVDVTANKTKKTITFPGLHLTAHADFISSAFNKALKSASVTATVSGDKLTVDLSNVQDVPNDLYDRTTTYVRESILEGSVTDIMENMLKQKISASSSSASTTCPKSKVTLVFDDTKYQSRGSIVIYNTLARMTKRCHRKISNDNCPEVSINIPDQTLKVSISRKLHEEIEKEGKGKSGGRQAIS